MHRQTLRRNDGGDPREICNQVPSHEARDFLIHHPWRRAAIQREPVVQRVPLVLRDPVGQGPTTSGGGCGGRRSTAAPPLSVAPGSTWSGAGGVVGPCDMPGSLVVEHGPTDLHEAALGARV